MSSIFTNLLFMHGHITNLELARRLAETPEPTTKPTGKRKRAASDAARKAVASAPLAQGSCGQMSVTDPRAGNVIVTALRWATAR
jgi:hypothetical protein